MNGDGATISENILSPPLPPVDVDHLLSVFPCFRRYLWDTYSARDVTETILEYPF